MQTLNTKNGEPMNCKSCGKPLTRILPGNLCEGCYNYFRKGGTIHPLPDPGRIEHDDDGKVICHICGRSYKRLGSHIRESHGMTIEEYKEQFGLCRKARTTEKSYSDKMHRHALDRGMDERVLEIGQNTRIRKGETHMRKGKEVRLQEILDKKDRRKK